MKKDWRLKERKGKEWDEWNRNNEKDGEMEKQWKRENERKRKKEVERKRGIAKGRRVERRRDEDREQNKEKGGERDIGCVFTFHRPSVKTKSHRNSIFIMHLSPRDL